MREIKLEKPRDLDILLAGLYAQPLKGLEQLRLFDKVLTALEHIAVIDYDENGNVRPWKTDENGNPQMGADGRPVRATYLKELPCTLKLEDGHASFLAARIRSADWVGQAVRDVLRLVEQMEPDTQVNNE